jgi:hypothetical protein
MDSTALTGVNCDVCSVTNVRSRSFCGLLIYREGVPYKWIDQPYTIRLRPGNTIEYLEQIPSIAGVQTQDRITIALSQTGFSTSQGMIDSTYCHCSGIQTDTTALFYASDSLNHAPIFKGDTISIIGTGVAQVTFDSTLKKYTINVDSVSGGSGIDTVKAIQPAAGLTITGSPGVAPVVTLTFSLANDLAAIEALSTNGILARTGSETYATRTIEAGTGAITVTNGDGIGGNPTISNTDPDQSTTNEIQTYSHGFASGTYTNTLSLGGGAWSIVGAGIAEITQTAGAITVTATESQSANNGLSDNEAGGGIFRLGNRWMNGSDGPFSNDRQVNISGSSLFLGDNSDSTLLHIDGANDRVGIHTPSPGRTFTVNGDVEIKDLITTDPTFLVGADGNGVLSEDTLG